MMGWFDGPFKSHMDVGKDEMENHRVRFSKPHRELEATVRKLEKAIEEQLTMLREYLKVEVVHPSDKPYLRKITTRRK